MRYIKGLLSGLGMTCDLCTRTFLMPWNLTVACRGQGGCKARICRTCIHRWYTLNDRGNIVNVSALTCPFCRRRPNYWAAVPTRHRALGGWKEAIDEADTWIYAWCDVCDSAKRYMERGCDAEGDGRRKIMHPGKGWRCSDCNSKGDPVVSAAKRCPNCGVLSVKVTGCDHLRCIKCRHHWCWGCGGSRSYAWLTEGGYCGCVHVSYR
ncbi:hypothetical protein V8F20_001308 [Naviculisporaceae sp. PSN 640]